MIASLAALLLAIAPALAQDAPTPPPRLPQQPDPMIQKIVSQISEDRIAAILKKLESFGTRNTMSDPTQPDRGVGAARQWILDQFKSYSPRLQVSFDTYQIPRGGRIWKDIEVRNVVAILPGKMNEAKDRWIMIGGHYDSINLRVPAEMRGDQAKSAEVVAPGVSDDASGVACSMECARVLSQYEFDATLVFVAFVGEEQGLIGAHAMARRLRGANQEIEALLNVDTVGNDVSGNGTKDDRRVLVFSEDPVDSPSRQIARFVKLMAGRYFPEMLVDMVFRTDRSGRGGDHTAFTQEGYAAVRFTTPVENLGAQHSPDDTFANASPSYNAKVARIDAAALAEMALAPRPPITQVAAAGAGAGARGATTRAARGATTRGANARGAAARGGVARGAAGGGRGGLGVTRTNTYDATLRWDDPNPEPDLAGFIVVMRATTAPDWEREVWVGNVHQYVLKNTSIDQFIFGVKAVDRDGHESPVAAYAPAARQTTATAEQ